MGHFKGLSGASFLMISQEGFRMTSFRTGRAFQGPLIFVSLFMTRYFCSSKPFGQVELSNSLSAMVLFIRSQLLLQWKSFKETRALRGFLTHVSPFMLSQ